MHKDQRGVSLVELVIVVAMVGLVASAITATAFQVFNLSTRASNRMAAIRQVQQAGFWVSPDVMMAQNVTVGGPAGRFLTLNWTEATGNRTHGVVYRLVCPHGNVTAPGNVTALQLQRRHYVNLILDSTMVVAQYIMPAGQGTSLAWSKTTRTLDFTVTATVGGQSETRTYLAKARPTPS